MRAAVYAGTRNLYPYMVNSAKSLLNFSNVEKIYFLIEDDIFPYQLPNMFQCINVSNQTYIKHNPRVQLNTDKFSFMVYIRAAYTKIFNNLDKILTIDVDTLVQDNISDLWDLDLKNYYLAAVPENQPANGYNNPYVNMGVAMLNLQKIRQDQIDDKIINALENQYFHYNQQDAFNKFCYNKILLLSSDYNHFYNSAIPKNEKIIHFAGVSNKYIYKEFSYYKDIKFENIKRNHKVDLKLDIIIPTYKNKKGLRDTLNSININNLNNLNILVINDCDGQNYDDIQKEYPYINFYSLQKNIGPGMVRQFGLDHSSNDYIMFMDTGDLFESNAFEIIFNDIKENNSYNVFTWAYYDRWGNIIHRHVNENTTIGFIYKRSFINIHNIHLCAECTMLSDWYINELCRILTSFYSKFSIGGLYTSSQPIFRMTLDTQSITCARDRKQGLSNFTLRKEIPWLIKDESRAIDMALYNHVAPLYIAESCLKTMHKIYFLLFISIYQDDSEWLKVHWPHIREFYINYYKPYSQPMYQINTRPFFNIRTTKYIKWNYPFKINYNKFLQDLEQNEELPNCYLTGENNNG